MSAAKLRRTPIQGAWAATPYRALSAGKRDGILTSTNPCGKQRLSWSNARSDKGKPEMPVDSVWMGKNVDTPSLRPEFLFEDPEEELKVKPTDESFPKGTNSRSSNVTEVKGNLFKCPRGTSLAHCVSEDLRMGKGIAVLFKNKFGGLDDLKRQGAEVGDVAVLQREARHIYYLISKTKYWEKPTYSSLESCLIKMREHCKHNGVTELAMPMIGCGLDGLQWSSVKNIIASVFKATDVNVTIYSF